MQAELTLFILGVDPVQTERVEVGIESQIRAHALDGVSTFAIGSTFLEAYGLRLDFEPDAAPARLDSDIASSTLLVPLRAQGERFEPDDVRSSVLSLEASASVRRAFWALPIARPVQSEELGEARGRLPGADVLTAGLQTRTQTFTGLFQGIVPSGFAWHSIAKPFARSRSLNGPFIGVPARLRSWPQAGSSPKTKAGQASG